MSAPLDLLALQATKGRAVAWLVQERYIISLFHAARALHAWLVQVTVSLVRFAQQRIRQNWLLTYFLI